MTIVEEVIRRNVSGRVKDGSAKRVNWLQTPIELSAVSYIRKNTAGTNLHVNLAINTFFRTGVES